MVHEIGHAIGFDHEHQRFGRGDFVDIFEQNIQPEYVFALAQDFTNNYDIPYDYTSVMHYFATVNVLTKYSRWWYYINYPQVKM